MAKKPRYQVMSVDDDEKPWVIRDMKDKERIKQRFRFLKNALFEAKRLNKENGRK